MSSKSPLTCNSCEKCGKKYKKLGTLNRHMKKHSGIKPHQCDRCGESFAVKDFLRVHMLTHYDDSLLAHTAKRKVTKISGRTRKFQNDFEDGEIGQKSKCPRSKVKAFHCSRCSLSFSRKDNLAAHTSTHVKTIAFRCENACSFECYSESVMQEHVASHAEFSVYSMHEVTYKPLKCPKCTMRFSRKGGLITHMRIHEKVKRFACELCDYQSCWITRMKLHALTHLKE